MKLALKTIKILAIIELSMCLVSCNNVVRVNESSNETQELQATDITESQNYRGITTCEEGQELAKSDIKDGKLKYIFCGFGSKQQLADNLETMYDIEIIRTKGVLGIPNKCYNDIMYAEIQRKFGNDAFNKAME